MLLLLPLDGPTAREGASGVGAVAVRRPAALAMRVAAEGRLERARGWGAAVLARRRERLAVGATAAAGALAATLAVTAPLAVPLAADLALAAGVALAAGFVATLPAVRAAGWPAALPAPLAVALERAGALAVVGAGGCCVSSTEAFLPRGLAALRRGVEGWAVRVRWDSTRAHSSSLRLAGLAPWALASLAAFSISATRLVQDVAKRLSDCDLAPLSTRVSTTPAAETFLRRRLKISFWSWAIRASALSLS